MGDRINAIKQDWIDDIDEMLATLSGDPAFKLKSFSKMSSADLNRLHTFLGSIEHRLVPLGGSQPAFGACRPDEQLSPTQGPYLNTKGPQ